MGVVIFSSIGQWSLFSGGRISAWSTLLNIGGVVSILSGVVAWISLTVCGYLVGAVGISLKSVR